MNTKKLLKLIALIAMFALLLTACGNQETAEPETTLPAEVLPVELGLTEWTLDASIWSGGNGASIDLTAVPKGYEEGMTATFVVRLEGEDVTATPCEWNGTAFTSYADLNAEDGYCYYVVMKGADGTELTVEVNTPTAAYNDALINLAASLESFCHTTVSDASFSDETLTILQGSAQVQPPKVTVDGKAVTCTEARLVLNLDGGALTQETLEIPSELGEDGRYTFDLTNIAFHVPAMEGDHQLTLTLYADLSDGTLLEDTGSTAWFYTDGTVQMTVG